MNAKHEILGVNKLAIGQGLASNGQPIFILEIDGIRYGFPSEGAKAIAQAANTFVAAHPTIEIVGVPK